MSGRREFLGAATVVAAGAVFGSPVKAVERRGCTAWVWGVMQQMAAVKPGMTRAELFKVFQGEGGLSTRTQQTVVSKACPYFKVDVEFVEEAGWRRDAEGRLVDEDGAASDVIRSISTPYLAPMVAD